MVTSRPPRTGAFGIGAYGWSPGDRRAVLVTVTDAGVALLDRRRVAYAQALAAVMAELPDAA